MQGDASNCDTLVEPAEAYDGFQYRSQDTIKHNI